MRPNPLPLFTFGCLGATVVAGGATLVWPHPLLFYTTAAFGVTAGALAAWWTRGRPSPASPVLAWEFEATRQSNRIGLIRWSLDRTRMEPSPECAALFGYRHGTPRLSRQDLLQAVTHHDRAWAEARWIEIGAGGRVPPQVFTIHGNDGAVRTLRFDVHFPPPQAAEAGPIEIIRDISHRQVTSRDFDEGQAYLTHLIRSLPGSVFHLERDPNGEYSLPYVSEGVGEALLPTGIEGQERFAVLLSHLEPEHRSRLLTSLAHSASNMEVWRHDVALAQTDGLRWLRFHAQPSREGMRISWRGMAVDATAEKAVEHELRLTRFAMDNAQDLISIVNEEGRRLYVNEAFCHFTGRSVAELNQSRVWDNLPAYGESGYKQLWRRVKEAGALVLEVDLRHRSGGSRPVEVNCRFLTINGVEAVCTVSRDISPRRQAERERQLMEQQLRETQKLESLGVLAGGIAHDFNNLLTGILGNASLARDRLPEGDPLHRPLQQVEKAAVRAGELCQQMLAYAGKGRVIVGPVDLSSLVDETAHLLHVSIARRASLDLRLAENLPLVQADATQIRQIVMNLVLNAAEAVQPPKGVITIFTGTLQVSREFIQSARVCHGMEPGECVFLEVRDNGVGMDPATLERIFEPFFTTKFTGRGLGLAAVLGIVRSHHGLLNVTSQSGEGTTFQLVLSPEGRPAPARKSVAVAPPSPIRRYARVLIIDDEESVRQVASQSLERSGCKVEVADSGETALGLLRQAIADPHLILLDFTMPHRDGLSVLRSIREIKPHIPVIMMSGFSEEETRERLQGVTIEGFLSKPFTLVQLRQTVESLIKFSRIQSATER